MRRVGGKNAQFDEFDNSYNIMKFLVLFSILIIVQTCQSLPLNSESKNVTEVEITSKTPKEIKIKCQNDDEKCEKRRKKRQNLCEKHTDLCGSEEEEDEEDCDGDDCDDSIDYNDNPGLNENDDQKNVRDIIIEGNNETHHYRGIIESGANVTTIIRLTNVIENKNYIDMPTTLNNTNVNNIHIYNNHSSETGGKFGLGYTKDGPCCYSIKPKNCRLTSAGEQCKNQRKKVCGKFCKSRVIRHTQMKHNHPQIPYQMPMQNFYYPQQFPFYPQQMPQIPYFMPQNYDSYDEDEDVDEEIVVFNKNDKEWIKVAEKCKIVSEDGLKIFNCTDDEYEHPFAANINTDVNGARVRRHKKHISNHKEDHESSYYPQPIYYPVPVYMQPMQMFIPQPIQQFNHHRKYSYDDFDDDDDEEEDIDLDQRRKRSPKPKKSNQKVFHEEI
jgi:hypothetical protein